MTDIEIIKCFSPVEGDTLHKSSRDLLPIACPEYLTEISDPEHRPWSCGLFPKYATIFDEWKRSDTDLDLFDWLKCEEGVKIINDYGYDLCERVTYLDEESIKSYKITLNSEGKLCTCKGDLLDTCMYNTEERGSGWASIVEDIDGSIYVGNHAPGYLQHSSFTQGKPVLFAGEVYCVKGVIKKISNNSGHYRPRQLHTLQFINNLSKIGVQVCDLEIIDQGNNRSSITVNSPVDIENLIFKEMFSSKNQVNTVLKTTASKILNGVATVHFEDFKKLMEYIGKKVNIFHPLIVNAKCDSYKDKNSKEDIFENVNHRSRKKTFSI